LCFSKRIDGKILRVNYYYNFIMKEKIVEKENKRKNNFKKNLNIIIFEKFYKIQNHDQNFL
jgi:hypothetical protein